MLTLLIALQLMASPPAPEPRPPQPRQESVDDRYFTMAFDPAQDAQAELDLALAGVAGTDKKILLIMGADWCHDSAALANLLDSPRFVGLISERYRIVFVDSGTPQIGKGRNMQIARQYGFDNVKSTPLLVVLSPEGRRLNSKKDAIGWRNAASRDEDEIFRYFESFKPTQK